MFYCQLFCSRNRAVFTILCLFLQYGFSIKFPLESIPFLLKLWYDKNNVYFHKESNTFFVDRELYLDGVKKWIQSIFL